jgi:hypothetical protein
MDAIAAWLCAKGAIRASVEKSQAKPRLMVFLRNELRAAL